MITKDLEKIEGKPQHGHKKGGWSQKRFERLQEQATHEYLVKVGEKVNEKFSGENLDGIIVGGPGLIKKQFIDGNYIKKELKEKIIAVIDTGYDGKDGIRELIQKSGEILKETEFEKEKEIIQKFMEEISKGSGMVEYGLPETISCINSSMASIILLSESLSGKMLEKMEKPSVETGAVIKMISTETEEGKMFLSSFGGIGAFLRWKKEG